MKSAWCIVLSISFTLGKGGQGRPLYYMKFFMLYLFLRMAALKSPESRFCQPCTHLFFRGNDNKE